MRCVHTLAGEPRPAGGRCNEGIVGCNHGGRAAQPACHARVPLNPHLMRRLPITPSPGQRTSVGGRVNLKGEEAERDVDNDGVQVGGHKSRLKACAANATSMVSQPNPPAQSNCAQTCSSLRVLLNQQCPTTAALTTVGSVHNHANRDEDGGSVQVHVCREMRRRGHAMFSGLQRVSR